MNDDYLSPKKFLLLLFYYFESIMKKTLLIALVVAVSACNPLNPSVMFKTSKDYTYTIDQTIGTSEYRIAPNDIIELNVYSNEGFKLLDQTATSGQLMTNGGQGGNNTMGGIRFVSDVEGFVKLPIIGRVKIRDLTVREAEKMLEQQYSTYYNKPFVMLNVVNKRVLVFPGSGGSGTVVYLENENTTLIEALAKSGGITEIGKAYKIKLIRGNLRNPQVMLIDLSTIDGMQSANLLLQANDIIYVEPTPQVSQGFWSQISPVVSVLTSAFLIYSIVTQINK